MEQPIKEPFLWALYISWKRSGGVWDFSSYRSTTPPVKSVKASLVRPPLNASYDPFNLYTQVLKVLNIRIWIRECKTKWMTHYKGCITWRKLSPASHSRTRSDLLSACRWACFLEREVDRLWEPRSIFRTARIESGILLQHQSAEIIKASKTSSNHSKMETQVILPISNSK